MGVVKFHDVWDRAWGADTLQYLVSVHHLLPLSFPNRVRATSRDLCAARADKIGRVT
jgi:hypothetical protein